MNICFVSEQAFDLLTTGGQAVVGGAEKQQLLLARELRRHGHTTSFVVADHGQAAVLDSLHGPVYRIARSNRRMPGFTLMDYWRSLLRTLDKTGAHVFYLRGATPHVLPVALWCRARGRASVFSPANDGDLKITGPPFLAARYRLAHIAGLLAVNRIVTQHEGQKRLLRRRFLRRASVVGSAVDLPENATVSRLRSSGARRTILFLGRQDALKRPLLFGELAAALPQHTFVMCGGGSGEASGQPGASGLGNLRDVGHVPPARVPEYLAQAALVVNTSSSEGLPNAMLEAWAWEVPVLSLSVDPGGIMAANGLGRPSVTMPALVAETARLMEDHDAREALGGRCRDYVKANHRPELVAARFLEAIHGDRR